MVNTEHRAVNVIDDIISQTELLDPKFNKDDKEASWDGFIYAYRNKNKPKDKMYGRAPVQIKGTSNNPKRNNTISYRVKYSDISNYRADGGALFFVVYVDESGDRTVFYNDLLPYKLNELLEYNKGKKSFALQLKALPSNTKDIENIVINFVENKQRQQNPSRKNWTIEELQKSFQLNKTTIKYRFTDVCKRKDPLDYMFNNYTEMYVPVEVAQQEYPIGSARLECMQTVVKSPVCIDGKKYYDKYIVNRDRKGWAVSIGGDLLKIRFNGNKTMFTFKVDGNLPSQIRKAEFLLKAFESGRIDLGDQDVSFDPMLFSKDDRNHIEELRKKNDWNNELQTVLDNLGVKKALSFSGWEKRDAFYADKLIRSVIYKESVDLPPSLSALSILTVGNINVGVLCERNDEGKCLIRNMFDEELNIYLSTHDSHMPTSQYVLLKKNDFMKLDNINYDVIMNSLSHFHSKEHYTYVNQLLLELIMAYDEVKEASMLDAAEKISKWLHDEEPEDDCFVINWYQTLYRINENDNKINQYDLRRIANASDDNLLRVAAMILLEDNDGAKRVLEEISAEQKDVFMSYPIAKLIK